MCIGTTNQTHTVVEPTILWVFGRKQATHGTKCYATIEDNYFVAVVMITAPYHISSTLGDYTTLSPDILPLEILIT